MTVNLQEKLDEKVCDAYFGYWELCLNRISDKNQDLNKRKDQSKSTTTLEEAKIYNKLSQFNSMKAQSLMKFPREVNQKEAYEKLKSAMLANEVCEICSQSSKNVKFVTL